MSFSDVSNAHQRNSRKAKNDKALSRRIKSYVYLLIYMQRLWEDLADLPGVFPDGRALPRGHI